MATQEEKIAAVEKGAAAFAELETALEGVEALANDTIEAIKAVYSLGVGRQGELLSFTLKLKAEIGVVSGALERVLAVHSAATEVAKREGCDAGLPQTYAVTGGVTPLSGSR